MTTATQQTVRSLMLIDGKAVASSDGRFIDIENPSNRPPIAQVPRGTEADVDAAVGDRPVAARHQPLRQAAAGGNSTRSTGQRQVRSGGLPRPPEWA